MKSSIRTVGDVRKEKLLSNAIEEKNFASMVRESHLPFRPDIGILNRAGRMMYYVYIESKYHESFELSVIERLVSEAMRNEQSIGS